MGVRDDTWGYNPDNDSWREQRAYIAKRRLGISTQGMGEIEAHYTEKWAQEVCEKLDDLQRSAYGDR